MKSLFRSHPVTLAVLLLFAALTPVMILRDFTPANELRYLSIADEAIANGNVFAFTNHGEAYADKPPLYFWLIMLSRLIFGTHSIFMLSLLSLLPALVTVWVMDRWMVLESDRSHRSLSFSDRFASSLMLGTCSLFLGTAVFLRMDMLMCMFIVLSLFSFYKMYAGIGNRKINGLLLPLYIFLALFTKGPVGLLLPPLSIVVFLFTEGRIKDVFQYLGLKTWGIIACLCAVWFTGVWIDGGSSYLENLLFHQTVDRAVNAFHHKEPFWYYFMVIWYVVAPYSAMLVAGFAASFFVKGYRTLAGRLYAVIVAVAFIMLSSFSSKLAIYLLPVFPFMVCLYSVESVRFGKSWWIKVSLFIPALIFFLAGALAIVGMSLWEKIPELAALIGQYDFAISPLTYMAVSMLAAGGAAAMFYIVRDGGWQKPVISMALSMLACILTVSPLLPKANDYVGYGNLCAMAERLSLESGENCAFVTLHVYRPENMDVYLGEEVRDFGHEEERYLNSELGPHVLMVKSSEIEEGSELSARLSVLPYEQNGEYRCYVVE